MNRGDTSRHSPEIYIDDAIPAGPANPPEPGDFRLLPQTIELLSTKTQNALLRAGYRSTDQILAATDRELARIRWFGHTAMAEVATWRAALLAPDPHLFRRTHHRLTELLETYACPCAPVVAAAVMRDTWTMLSQEPLTAQRLQQMLLPAPIEA